MPKKPAGPSRFLWHKSREQQIIVASFNHEELETFNALCPHIPVYGLEHTAPFDVIHQAMEHGFTGIDINFWILNPLTYYWARRKNLEIIVYTVNKIWIARFLKFFYPHISITTNNPDKLGFLSDVKKREKAIKKAAAERASTRRSRTV